MRPELIQRLLSELSMFRLGAEFQQEPYKSKVFGIFQEQFRDALIDEAQLRQIVQGGVASDEFKVLEPVLRQVCDAWREWLYAAQRFL